MAVVADLRGVVERALVPLITTELAAFGRAAALSMQAEAPVRTGALRSSILWELTGPLSGQFRMRAYAIPIERGHVVARWGTSRRPRRKYKTSGYVAANPFLSRGVAATSVAGLSADQLTAVRAAVLAAIAAIRGGP